MAAKKIICDTDVMVDYWNTNNSRHAATKSIVDDNIGIDNVVISAITKMELLVGALNKKDLAKITKNLDPLTIALINNEITLTAFALIEKYTLSHWLALPDGVIAATAVITGLELFTYNIKDYQFITGLKLFKP
jgi:predicted nucleic acid-binding protein